MTATDNLNPALPWHHDGKGNVFALGCRPAPPGMMMARSATPTIPEAQWSPCEHNLGPVPIKNQTTYGACFPGETTVLMGDGSNKPIRDVRVGDVVISHLGVRRKVVEVMSRPHRGDVVSISMPYSYPVVATPEHPVYAPAKGVWTPASDLRPGDLIRVFSTLPLASVADDGTVREEPNPGLWFGDLVYGAGDQVTAETEPERSHFDGFVYNIEVEVDHSYVAGGLAVHNCDGHAAATSLEIVRWFQKGEFIELSPWYIYAILCNGVDRGASISEALTLLMQQGTCPFTDVPYGTINPKKLTQAAHDDAMSYRIGAGLGMGTWEDLVTATLLKQVYNGSLCVGPNFSNLSAEGVVPFWPGGGNHAVTGGLGLKKLKSGEWAIKYQNSWGTDWGQGGYFWVTRRSIDKQWGFDSYRVEAAADDPKGATNPPLAAAA